MINCKQATRLLSESLDRPLSIKEKAVLAMHTSMCSGCRNFGKQMGSIRQITKQYVREDPNDSTSD